MEDLDVEKIFVVKEEENKANELEDLKKKVKKDIKALESKNAEWTLDREETTKKKKKKKKKVDLTYLNTKSSQTKSYVA